MSVRAAIQVDLHAWDLVIEYDDGSSVAEVANLGVHRIPPFRLLPFERGRHGKPLTGKNWATI